MREASVGGLLSAMKSDLSFEDEFKGSRNASFWS